VNSRQRGLVRLRVQVSGAGAVGVGFIDWAQLLYFPAVPGPLAPNALSDGPMELITFKKLLVRVV
jgi:hypothetical protein